MSESRNERQPGSAPEQLANASAQMLTNMHLRLGGQAQDVGALHRAGRLLWQAVQSGDSCVSLPAGAQSAMRAALRNSPVAWVLDEAGADDDVLSQALVARPVVLQGRQLYAWRYWQAERTVARALHELASAKRMLRIESQADDTRLNDAQNRALKLANEHRLLIVTGGPGTGKTHCLAAIVRQQLAASPQARVALSAPTGKAAARLADALAADLNEPGGPANHKAAVQASTLHRLLAWDTRRLERASARSALPFDLIIVDECSMLDLLMAARLLESLGPETLLILAGDHQQLAAVEAGGFFDAVCASTEDPIAACKVVLTVNYRQQSAPQILQMAQSILTGKIDALPLGQQVFADLATHTNDQVENAGTSSKQVAALLDLAVQEFQPLFDRAQLALSDQDRAQLVRDYNAVRVLAPLRAGPAGVLSLNRRLLMRLTGTTELDRQCFSGRLIIVTKNAPALNLYNGDVGLCLLLEGRIGVLFEQGGDLRHYSPLQLPAWQDALAMTIHQSQGSDFDHVILLAAPAEHPLATRQSLYTGVTRARKKLSLFGHQQDIEWAARHAGSHDSGLLARLDGFVTPSPVRELASPAEVATESATNTRNDTTEQGPPEQGSLF